MRADENVPNRKGVRSRGEVEAKRQGHIFPDGIKSLSFVRAVYLRSLFHVPPTSGERKHLCQSVAADGSMVEVNFQCYTCFSEFCVSLTHSLFFSLVMFVLLFYSFFLFYIPPSPSHTHTHTDTVSYNSILFSCG